MQLFDVAHHPGEKVSAAAVGEPGGGKGFEALVEPGSQGGEQPEGDVVGDEPLLVAREPPRPAEDLHEDRSRNQGAQGRMERGERDQEPRASQNPHVGPHRPHREQDRHPLQARLLLGALADQDHQDDDCRAGGEKNDPAQRVQPKDADGDHDRDQRAQVNLRQIAGGVRLEPLHALHGGRYELARPLAAAV